MATTKTNIEDETLKHVNKGIDADIIHAATTHLDPLNPIHISFDEKNHTIAPEGYYVVRCETSRIKTNSDGKNYDFLAFKTFETKTGKTAKLKFTKTAKLIPDSEGNTELIIKHGDINKDKGSIYNQYWVKKVTAIIDISAIPVAVDEDLPF